MIELDNGFPLFTKDYDDDLSRLKDEIYRLKTYNIALKQSLRSITRANEVPPKKRSPIWREEVISRDKVCQCCGFDKHLEVHHIFSHKDYNDLTDDLNNGITLCKFCHNKYHSAYGRDGANPRDLAEFMRRFSVR